MYDTGYGYDKYVMYDTGKVGRRAELHQYDLVVATVWRVPY